MRRAATEPAGHPDPFPRTGKAKLSYPCEFGAAHYTPMSYSVEGIKVMYTRQNDKYA